MRESKRVVYWVSYTDFLTRKRAANFTVNFKLFSTEALCACRDTSQAGIIFNSMSVHVNLCNCKVHQKLESRAVPKWHDAPDEEGKERHWKIHQKLVCSPGSYVYINSRAKVRWEKPTSSAESGDRGVNGECMLCTQNPDLGVLTWVFWTIGEGVWDKLILTKSVHVNCAPLVRTGALSPSTVGGVASSKHHAHTSDTSSPLACLLK